MIAKPDDLDYELVKTAYLNISLDADRRARFQQQNYADVVNGVYAELLPLATTDAQRAVLDAEIVRYRDRYLDHLRAVLSAKSRTASPMVTGPARFNTGRNDKAFETEARRVDEMLAWDKRAREAMRKAILLARTSDTVLDEAWASLCEDMTASLNRIAAVDEGRRGPARTLVLSNMTGMVERLARNGNVELVERATALVRDYNDQHPRPAMTPKHKFWTFVGVAHRHREAMQGDTGTVVVTSVDGVQIVNNADADRIQIVFTEKPSETVREALKRAGWRWTPSQGLYQRQRTPNAVQSAHQIVAVCQQG